MDWNIHKIIRQATVCTLLLCYILIINSNFITVAFIIILKLVSIKYLTPTRFNKFNQIIINNIFFTAHYLNINYCIIYLKIYVRFSLWKCRTMNFTIQLHSTFIIQFPGGYLYYVWCIWKQSRTLLVNNIGMIESTV